MIYDWYLWLVFVKSFLKAKGLGVEMICLELFFRIQQNKKGPLRSLDQWAFLNIWFSPSNTISYERSPEGKKKKKKSSSNVKKLLVCIQ